MILHPNQSSQNMDLLVCQDVKLWFILLQKPFFKMFLQLLFILQSINIFGWSKREANLWMGQKMTWIFCQLIKFKRKGWIQNQFYFQLLLTPSSWFRFMVWQTNLMKISYLVIWSVCPLERCNQIFLLRWWKIRLGRRRKNYNDFINYL